ncbi:MAG: amino acid adenylation domain-containing protein [Janthinobacterium lividum]
MIEYLGRRDQQIKIRGQRLELGEVETRLQRCEGVEEAVAIARTSPLGELQIVAYWAARDMPFAQGMGQAEDALRREMAHHLPPYMVPSQFILLAHLPRNANGKIDRPALARLPWQETSRAFEAPATVLETRMAEIWSAVLGQGGIGRDDNFFALGGHSLLATKAMAHISRAFAVSLPLRAMFESPTLRELAARLALQLQDAPAGATDAGHDAALEGAALDLQPMPVVDRRRSWPLSFSQQRLWIVDQFEQHGALYNMAHAISLQGALDSGLLVAALNDIVARHEVLRTAFERVDGQPVQRIAPFAQLHCPLVDLRHLPADQRTARARQLAAEEGLRPFDLRAAPLLRAQLLCLGEEQHWLLLTVHHIAADAWSSAILARELAAFYHARLHDTAPLLPVLPVQYVDYAVWQQHWQQGSVHQRQLDYWRTELAGAPASLTLPTDHPRPAVNSGRGACIDLQIDGTLAARLQTLALATRTSLFMVLSSVYALLLGRYSAQDDVSVGTPVANRERSEVADLIGFFVNTLVLRFRLHGQSTQSFADLLLQTREMALGAYANQDIAFEQIVQELEPERQGAQTPLFQAMFVLQNGQAATEHFDGLVAHTLDLDPLPVARFDLTLQVTELAQGLAPGAPGLQARFIFNADLFEAQTIERFGQHFHHMLEQVSERPQLALAELDWLRADEKQQILGQWNQTRVTRARDQTIQQLFEACVRRYRDEVAVVFEHQSLSYDELNRRANQLAHHLRALGIGHDDLVCLCIERSIDMVVGILGVLKAGGAYLPLDPAMPATRFASVFASARPRLLLTQQALAARHECGTVPKLCLDDETLWRLPLSQDNPLLRTDPNNLAYVIYTSGTTGQPKGTLIHHGGLTNLVYAQQDAFGVKAGMNVLQWASLTFDAAVSEIFTALTMGARLYLASSDALLPGENLLRTLRHYQIALVTLTPSALAALPLARLPCLKTLVVAGERCDPAIIAPWSQQLTVINAYGPTEVTVCATVHAVAGDARRPPPIGKPIANTQTYILDANLQPVPIGVTGELYLGGEGLARGYLNQPDMTAERFIPNPHSQQAGARLYRTGDLARFLPNGNIDYIGRIDSQVKLRGYRIEPSEIAFALTELPAVAEAVVVMQKTAAGDPRLVAYVVRQQLREPLGTAAEANVCRSVLPAPATAASLRSALLAVLPGYMVPAHFVFVTSLPRNRSGKLDRAALDLVSWSQEDSGVEGALAASASEQQLEPLWCQLLERRQVGRDEDFFALGGHSLLAVRLMARINAAFESILARPMPVSQLFQTPTIGALAAVIDSGRSSARLLVPLKPGRSAGGTPKPPVWLLHPAGGTVFCYRKLAARFYPAWPVHALQSAEMAGLPCTDHDLDSLCRTYMAQISQHQPDGAVHLAGWSLGGVLAFRIAEMLEQAGREIAWVAIFDSLLYQLSQPRRFETFMVWALTSMQGEAWAQSPLDANARQRCAAYLAEHGGAQLERALAAAPDLLQDELGLNTDDVAFFRQQYEVQERQIALIDGFQPGHIKAPLHVFFAHQTDPARRRDSNWLAHTAARAESTMRVVPGTHENLILIEENITCMSRTLGLCA